MHRTHTCTPINIIIMKNKISLKAEKPMDRSLKNFQTLYILVFYQ